MRRVSEDMINMMLRQMGATKITALPAYVTNVEFEIAPDLTVGYFYNATEGDEIYLQRTFPYAMRIGKLYSEEDLVACIERDVQKFQNAHNSRNFEKYVKITKTLTTFDRTLEHVFMSHNISKNDLDKVEKIMLVMEHLIEDIEKKSPNLKKD